MSDKPYAEGVPAYVDAGWSGIIPVRKAKKTPAKSDVTGYSGHQLSGQESLELSRKRQFAACNLGLRLPPGLVGVDVDGYGDKVGLRTLAELESRFGPLPPTPYSTARGTDVPGSGIRFFRVPEELDFEHVFGPDIECIRYAHRFAVVYPSIHPTVGHPYRWYNGDNTLFNGVPSPGDFAELPPRWVERFGREPRQPRARVGHFDGVQDFLHANDTGEMLRYLDAAVRIFSAESGSRHDSMLKALGCAMRDAAAGMYPARSAVDRLHDLWGEATDGEDREAEFEALVERACSDAATEEVDPYRRAKVFPQEAVEVSESTRDKPDVVIFERRDPTEVAYLSEFVPDSYSVEWTQDLSQVQNIGAYSGRAVVVVPFEDPSVDQDTYRKCETFQSALYFVEATTSFVPVPTDIYSSVKAASNDEQRINLLRRQFENRTAKPAKRSPRSNKKRHLGLSRNTSNNEATQAEHEKNLLSDLGNRTLVEMSGDRKHDNDSVIAGVKQRWDGRKVFNYGGAIARVKEDRVIPQDKSMWMNTLVEACKFVSRDAKGMVKNTEPPSYVVSATLSRSEDFTELVGIKHAPFIRDDGTVSQDPGYDAKSKTKLFLSENLSGISVTENPSKDEVIAAREVLQDWLYDFFQIMPTETDKANALALVVTPFIRGSVPIVPLCVINGLQPGVGKNKFANGVSILYTGKTLVPNSFSVEDEEQRKSLMGIFREGRDLVCYDEAHVIEGKALAQALTAATWSDRVLGVSQIAEYPNNATWMSLGNNVRIEGDCARRVYQIQLKPNFPNPESRTAKDFKHPDFENWTADIRKKLLEAVLTMIRGWYAAGRPRPSVDASFGSFETWENLVRGILEYAGVTGFLGNQQEIRNGASYNFVYWVAHLEWLIDTFEGGSFTTNDVHQELMRGGLDSEPPPGMEDTSLRSYSRELGKIYSRMQDRFVDNYQLVRLDRKRSRSTLWKVRKVDDQ